MSSDHDKEIHYVYVVEIAPKWIPEIRPSLSPNQVCLYVGESADPPRKRFRQHRRGHDFLTRGGDAAARPFRKIKAKRVEQGQRGTLVDGEDAWLRRDLMADLEPVEGDDAAKYLELKTAESLRTKGYYVIGPKRKHRKSKSS